MSGYLGSTGQIKKPPAPAMVEAGYRLELDDGDFLYRGFGLADMAHILELRDAGLLQGPAFSDIASGLLDLHGREWADLSYDERYGDVFNVRERILEASVGQAAGWLSAGRPRREAGRIAYRVAMRHGVLDFAEALADLGRAIIAVAGDTATALMPDYTYLQAAQPSTFGHYLLSFAYPVLRDAERVRDAFAWVNGSPAGVGGSCGPSFCFDRERLARRLGFHAVIDHARDAMWQTDGIIDLSTTCFLAANTLSQLAEDLEIYGSHEFGFLKIGAEYCRASALMPQKRNPYALPIIRGGARTLLGRLTGIAAGQQTPSARTDNFLYVYGESQRSLDLTVRLIRLGSGVVRSLEIDVDHMRRATEREFVQAADLADAIVRHTDLDYRSAYRVVACLVSEHLASGRAPSDVDVEAVRRAVIAVLDMDLAVDASVVAEAMEPAAALRTRTVIGGAAPEPMATMLSDCGLRLDDLERWVLGERERIVAAEAALVGELEESSL